MCHTAGSGVPGRDEQRRRHEARAERQRARTESAPACHRSTDEGQQGRQGGDRGDPRGNLVAGRPSDLEAQGHREAYIASPEGSG